MVQFDSKNIKNDYIFDFSYFNSRKFNNKKVNLMFNCLNKINRSKYFLKFVKNINHDQINYKRNSK